MDPRNISLNDVDPFLGVREPPTEIFDIRRNDELIIEKKPTVTASIDNFMNEFFEDSDSGYSTPCSTQTSSPSISPFSTTSNINELRIHGSTSFNQWNPSPSPFDNDNFMNTFQYQNTRPFDDFYMSRPHLDVHDDLENNIIEAAKSFEQRIPQVPLYTSNNAVYGRIEVQAPVRHRKPRMQSISVIPGTRTLVQRMPFALLGGLALKNSPNNYEPVSRIYRFISANFNGYDLKDERWKKSLRHVLSTNHIFTKGPLRRNLYGAGRSHAHGGTWGFRDIGKIKFEDDLALFIDRMPDSSYYGLTAPKNWQLIRNGELGMPLEECSPVERQIQQTTKPSSPKEVEWVQQRSFLLPVRRANHGDPSDHGVSNWAPASSNLNNAGSTRTNFLQVERKESQCTEKRSTIGATNECSYAMPNNHLVRSATLMKSRTILSHMTSRRHAPYPNAAVTMINRGQRSMGTAEYGI